MAPKRATARGSRGGRCGSTVTRGKGVGRGSGTGKVTFSLLESEKGEENGGESPVAERWTVGCRILLSGTYPGKGKDRAYWRRQLGWLGTKNQRIHHRYEAVGDPTSPKNDRRRYLWVLEKGEWIGKGEWMEYKDLILECSRAGTRPHTWKGFLAGRTSAGAG
ncbi:uncharacterized protein CIMG_11199 [Coccidioides immitis RS]|uniref:Uncharacterized protein n=1 Tax=Coccidioides immitis (strain RS) TaxID=246410 RepID=A0A0D8JW69_COCIM|nr:uncharacterized protein CIMG_11199 [Coccidioides immitis RS]KJF61562.1 hypothetical protein CIMG_11199 [Coccidioides immitis RS]